MSHTILTLGSGAIVRKALSILHNKLVFVRSIDRQYDDRFAVRGAKIGDTLDIRLPNEFEVRTGAVMDTKDLTENMHELKLGTQKGVDIILHCPLICLIETHTTSMCSKSSCRMEPSKRNA